MRVDPGAPRGLDALQTLLTTARELVDGLVTDPQLGRIVRAFSMLPECDREPILKVLEKDAAWRRIVEETAGATGITVHPNPHASLYVHVLDQVTGQPRTPEPLLRDGDVIRLGVETFVRLLPLFFEEGVHAQWTAAARDIVRESDVELRGFAVRLAREVLGLVDEAAAEGAAPGPGSETGRLEPHPAARTARGPAK